MEEKPKRKAKKPVRRRAMAKRKISRSSPRKKNSKTAIKKPLIRWTSSAPLSPFVVHLEPEVAVDVAVSEPNARVVQVNFFVPENELIASSTMSTRDVLQLKPEEWLSQLQENDLTGPTRRIIPAAPVMKTLPFELDLPEPEEEEDESEILTLEELTATATERRSDRATPRLPLFPFFQLPVGWHRALAAFVLVSFAFVLPLHAMGTLSELRAARTDITANGAQALTHLQRAASSALQQNARAAVAGFSSAENHFAQADEAIQSINGSVSLLLSILPNTRKNYRAGEALLFAGEKLSEAGKRISEGLTRLDTPAASPTTKLNVLREYLASAAPKLEEARTALQDIDPELIPAEYRDTFLDLQTVLLPLTKTMETLVAFSHMASVLLGDEGRQRYLLVFQNNTEVRPTGGFMGSFARIDVARGEVQNMQIPGGGSYDLQGSLKKFIAAPDPLQLINARWEFQDANWFSDFPTSARQILDFYAASGEPSVDGVIAINATFVMELLSLLGPVDMPEYDRVIDADNFLFETQKVVELEYATYEKENDGRKEEAPKAFIGDLAGRLLERVNALKQDELLEILGHLYAGLMRKDIQLYVVEEDLEAAIQRQGFGGEIRQTDGDYLHIVDTNLGGGKTDGVMEQYVDLSVSIGEDGRIVNTLTISRTHHGLSNTLFTGVNNVDYLRVYVPRGSELLSASGFTIPDTSLFDIPEAEWETDPDVLAVETLMRVDPKSGTQMSEEFGKTVFGNWVQTAPGATSTVVFVYRLPFTVDLLTRDSGFLDTLKAQAGLRSLESYTLTLQKQSGVLDRNTNLHVEWPEQLAAVWRSEQQQDLQFTNDADAFWGVIFERAE